MPESGIQYVKRKDLLTFEEMYRLVHVFSKEGIRKLRITGGEPFLRSGIMEFLEAISGLKEIEEIHVTTNGSLTGDYLARLEALGISGINLSLDTLNRERFRKMTRRDMFSKVMQTMNYLIDSSIPLKINTVVMANQNTEDILPLIELTREHDLGVRFIEEMPFNGTGEFNADESWSAQQITDHILGHYEVQKLEDPKHSTSRNYRVKGYRGTFGIIAAFSRTFCGTCNRIRVTPQGTLRTCLYDDGHLSLRDLLRSTPSDLELVQALRKALSSRAADGFEAEKRNSNTESMATIGG